MSGEGSGLGGQTLYRSITALMVVGGLLMIGDVQAAIVTYVGGDVTTNADWRTTTVAKPLDQNGDNYYGTDGYHVYTGDGWMSSLPSYISSVDNIPGTGSGYTNAGLPDFDSASSWMSGEQITRHPHSV